MDRVQPPLVPRVEEKAKGELRDLIATPSKPIQVRHCPLEPVLSRYPQFGPHRAWSVWGDERRDQSRKTRTPEIKVSRCSLADRTTASEWCRSAKSCHSLAAPNGAL